MGKMQPTECGSRTLGYLSLVFGLVATGTLLLAVSTDFWLYATEWIDPMIVPSDEDYMDSSSSNNNNNDIINNNDNINNNTNSQSTDPDPYYTANIEVEDENSEDDEKYQDKTEFDGSKFLVKVNVHSGLWRSCVMGSEDQVYDDGITFHCTNIEYFGQDTDRTETTHAINRAIRKASPVITGSLLIMVVALSLSILGSNRRDVRALLAAILYITSALSLALGVILYISAVNDEVSHRRKSITGERDGFRYRYGWAFFFNGISFIASMIAAVNNISLYLLRPAAQQSAEGSNHVVNLPSSRSRIMINSTSESHALFEHDKESMIIDKDSVGNCVPIIPTEHYKSTHPNELFIEHKITNITTPV